MRYNGKSNIFCTVLLFILILLFSVKVSANMLHSKFGKCPICGNTNEYASANYSFSEMVSRDYEPFEIELMRHPFIYHCEFCRFTICNADYTDHNNGIFSQPERYPGLIEKTKALLQAFQFKEKLKDIKEIPLYQEFEIMEKIYQMLFDGKSVFSKDKTPYISVYWSRFYLFMGRAYEWSNLPEKAAFAYNKSLSTLKDWMYRFDDEYELNLLLYSGTLKHFLKDDVAALRDYRKLLLVRFSLGKEIIDNTPQRYLSLDTDITHYILINTKEILRTSRDKSIKLYYEFGMIYLINFFNIEPIHLLLYFSLFGLFILFYFVIVKTKNIFKARSYGVGLYFTFYFSYAGIVSILSYPVIKKVMKIGSIKALAIITLSYMAWTILIHWLPGKVKLTSNPSSLKIAFKQKFWFILKSLLIMFPFVFCLYLNPSIRAFFKSFFMSKDFEWEGFLFFSLLPFLGITLGIGIIYLSLDLIQKWIPGHFPGKTKDYLFPFLCLGVIIVGTGAFIYNTSIKVYPTIYILLGGIWFLLFVLIEYFFRAFTKYRIIRSDFLKRMYESKFWFLIRNSFLTVPIIIGYNYYWSYF